MSADAAPAGSGPEPGDAFGRALLDRLAGTDHAPVVVERDDGYVNVDSFDYLSGLDQRDEWALDRATGRVLDIGAGAGRASLALQERGQKVTALDVSAGAIQACRQRGVRSVHLGSVADAAAGGLAGSFDVALLLGNNLSLMSSRAAAAGFLTSITALLRPGGSIVGTCLDPHQTSKPAHLAYHQRNTEQGRMAGQIRMRVRYQRLASGWFDWLTMSPAELAGLASAAGWRIADQAPGIRYAVVLTKTHH